MRQLADDPDDHALIDGDTKTPGDSDANPGPSEAGEAGHAGSDIAKAAGSLFDELD